jgi:hypothetical protein
MTTSNQTLSAFILARIDEDEAVARATTPHEWDCDASIYEDIPPIAEGSFNRTDAAHIARHDPARVLATCKAHRAIVERFDTSDDIVIYPIVAALASVWSDHEDYRTEWNS